MKSPNRSLLLLALVTISALLAPALRAADTLEIDKAYVGNVGAWRDLTQYLQDEIDGGKLSIRLSQPFRKIGGDPAPGQVKNLLIDYRFNGQPFRLYLKEQYPVAFEVKIPSAQAEPPGANADAAAMMNSITSSSTLHVKRVQPSGLIVYTIGCISVLALVFSLSALSQLRQLRSPSRVPPIING